MQVASLTTSLTALQDELSQAQHRLADALRQAVAREEQQRAAISSLVASTAQQLQTTQAEHQEALSAAAAQHAAQVQSLQATAGSTSQLLQARVTALQEAHDELGKKCVSVQQQLAEEQGKRQREAGTHEARLAEARSLSSAAQQASGVHAALADSSKQLESLCLAVHQRMQQHHQLAQQAARQASAPQLPNMSLSAGMGGLEALLASQAASLQAAQSITAQDPTALRSQIEHLKAQVFSQDEEVAGLRLQAMQMQQSISDLVRLHGSALLVTCRAAHRS